MPLFRLVFSNIILLLLIGCASTQNSILKKDISWLQHETNVYSINNWHVVGKIGFTDGIQSGIANIKWKQIGEYFDIDISGPFNAWYLYIEKNFNGVTFGTSEGVYETAETPEEIVHKQLGWILPIKDLEYWSRGIPNPNKQTKLIQLSEQNRLKKLIQNGWTVEYHEYKVFNNFILPYKMTLKYNNIKVKIIFKNWF